MRRLVIWVAIALVGSIAVAPPPMAQQGDDADALNAEVVRLYQAGKYAEAIPLAERALAIAETALGASHPSVGMSLGNLAALYQTQGRFTEAVRLLKRDLAITETALGPDHPDVGTSLNNLAELYRAQGRYGEAEPLYKRALAIAETAFGADHPKVGFRLNNLAALYQQQRRFTEAEPLVKRALAIAETAFGADHPDVGRSLNDLASLYLQQGRFTEAEPLYQRSLAIWEKALGPDHPYVGTSLNNLAVLALKRSDWAQAAGYWRASTGVIQRRAARGLAGGAKGEASRGEASRNRSEFWGLVKMTHRLGPEGHSERVTFAHEMFETAQWAHASEAAGSLAQMAARSAKGDATLAALVRERQDLVGEWEAKDKLLIAAKSEAPDKRHRENEKVLADRLAAIDGRLAEIDARFAKDFPDYAALVSPKPISIPDVQAELRDDETLVLFLDTPEWKPTPEETFIWVITRTGSKWLRSDLGTEALTREVAALRCGLDATAWDGEGKGTCAGLLSIPEENAPKQNDPLPFDHGRAHKLYSALFSEVEDLIKGKQLLIVPSGPLTLLPFQVLVTKAPESSDLKNIGWLTRDHAITVLPAVSSLKALRRVGKPSAATKPMIGFGNPLLDGNQEHPKYGGYYKQQAALAKAHKGCAETTEVRTASLRGVRRNLTPMPQQGGHVDVGLVRRQAPLPETADELCAVARDLKTDVTDIRLGASATEREVKALSANGTLSGYRVLHFATHGTLAGQLSGTSEPGLILTPPATASEEDDGYLSASEIAELKLDADWVILSACNTAGAGDAGAEALSGLARAFIYAQARALLVSHWEVYSAATVKLITSAVGTISTEKTVGRAEALRHAMLSLIDKGAPHEAHPAYWAPFVVVGEGGAPVAH